MGVKKMLYMKVKESADNFVINKNFDFLVGNELYTIKEFEKIRNGFIAMGRNQETLNDKFDFVNVSKKKVYFFFGARFSNNTGVTVPF